MNYKVSDNPLKNRMFFDTPLMIVTGLFVTMYLVSNVMAVKIVLVVLVFLICIFDPCFVEDPHCIGLFELRHNVLLHDCSAYSIFIAKSFQTDKIN